MALAPAPSTEKGDWRKPVSTSAPQSPSQAFLTRMPEAPAGNDEHVKMQPVGSPMEDVVMNRPLAVAPAPIPDPAKTAKEIEDDHWSKLHILSQLCSAVLDHSTKDGDEPARDQEEAATLASMSQKPATLDVPHRQHSASLQTRQQARSEKQLNSGAPRQVSPAILPRTRKSKKQAALSTATVDESSSLSHVSASIPSTNEDQGVAALLSIATISAAASPLPPITSPHHPTSSAASNPQ
ncbi:hypothetical protein BC829DRAFT_56852 [Chytridium lagenaria]|nr:hypothetical protein BC829DRAFT_56852 [Chytridium lagenaria]